MQGLHPKLGYLPQAHPPDDSSSGVNIRATPPFLQARREVQANIGNSGVPNGDLMWLIWPLSSAL
jgi:hypothetical protein